MTIECVPFGFDVGDGAYVMFGSEHELVVDDPLGLVVEASRRMQLHYLIVFNGQVMAVSFQMRGLCNANSVTFN